MRFSCDLRMRKNGISWHLSLHKHSFWLNPARTYSDLEHIFLRTHCIDAILFIGNFAIDPVVVAHHVACESFSHRCRSRQIGLRSNTHHARSIRQNGSTPPYVFSHIFPPPKVRLLSLRSEGRLFYEEHDGQKAMRWHLANE